MRLDFKQILGFLFFILLFVGVSYYLQINMYVIERYMNLGLIGIIIYILIAFLATVFAPVSVIPLLPFAVNLYGWQLAAIYSLIGWMLGAVVAFYISRKFGVKIVEKFVSLKQAREYEKLIPKNDIFLSIVFVRIILPVDIVSYAIGLFSKIDFRTYFFASFIGMIPFAFILSYVGSKSIFYQVCSLIVIGIFIVIMHNYYKKYILK